MDRRQLISKLIELEEEAKSHNSKYLKLMGTPGKTAKANMHERKALKLRSRIQQVIRQIGLFVG